MIKKKYWKIISTIISVSAAVTIAVVTPVALILSRNNDSSKTEGEGNKTETDTQIKTNLSTISQKYQLNLKEDVGETLSQFGIWQIGAFNASDLKTTADSTSKTVQQGDLVNPIVGTYNGSITLNYQYSIDQMIDLKDLSQFDQTYKTKYHLDDLEIKYVPNSFVKDVKMLITDIKDLFTANDVGSIKFNLSFNYKYRPEITFIKEINWTNFFMSHDDWLKDFRIAKKYSNFTRNKSIFSTQQINEFVGTNKFTGKQNYMGWHKYTSWLRYDINYWTFWHIKQMEQNIIKTSTNTKYKNLDRLFVNSNNSTNNFKWLDDAKTKFEINYNYALRNKEWTPEETIKCILTDKKSADSCKSGLIIAEQKSPNVLIVQM